MGVVRTWVQAPKAEGMWSVWGIKECGFRIRILRELWLWMEEGLGCRLVTYDIVADIDFLQEEKVADFLAEYQFVRKKGGGFVCEKNYIRERGEHVVGKSKVSIMRLKPIYSCKIRGDVIPEPRQFPNVCIAG